MTYLASVSKSQNDRKINKGVYDTSASEAYREIHAKVRNELYDNLWWPVRDIVWNELGSRRIHFNAIGRNRDIS